MKNPVQIDIYKSMDVAQGMTDDFLVRCLTKYCKIHHVPYKGEFQIKRDHYGKPYCNINNVYLSVSHSNRYIVGAISNEPVGIDVELRNEQNNKRLLALLSGKVPDGSLITTWTKAESLSKLIGYGLTIGIEELIQGICSKNYIFRQIEIEQEYECFLCSCQTNRNVITNVYAM